MPVWRSIESFFSLLFSSSSKPKKAKSKDDVVDACKGKNDKKDKAKSKDDVADACKGKDDKKDTSKAKPEDGAVGNRSEIYKKWLTKPSMTNKKVRELIPDDRWWQIRMEDENHLLCQQLSELKSSGIEYVTSKDPKYQNSVWVQSTGLVGVEVWKTNTMLAVDRLPTGTKEEKAAKKKLTVKVEQASKRMLTVVRLKELGIQPKIRCSWGVPSSDGLASS